MKILCRFFKMSPNYMGDGNIPKSILFNTKEDCANYFSKHYECNTNTIMNLEYPDSFIAIKGNDCYAVGLDFCDVCD